VLLDETSSEYNLLHRSNSCGTIKLHISSWEYFLDVTFVLRRFFSLLDISDGIEDWLHDEGIKTFVNKSVWLWQNIHIDGWITH